MNTQDFLQITDASCTAVDSKGVNCAVNTINAHLAGDPSLLYGKRWAWLVVALGVSAAGYYLGGKAR